jgi:hypothetical protein
MARLYHRLFYQFYSFFSALAQEGWEEWKALVAVNTLCVLLLGEAGVWVAIAVKQTTGTLWNEPGWLGWVLVGACSLGNYAFFLLGDRWKAYSQEFQTEPALHQRWAAWGALILVVAVLGSVVVAFYCMSRLDWSQ